ncbi:MAG: hypothetical protein ACR2FG_03140 [Marmoricola sp.]
MATFVGCAAVAALVAAPISLERAVEGVHFSDDLGTFPVEVSLCHDGRSTLDTGLFGKVFWSRTGTLGFGAYARATGPPEAGGTLASYVDPQFIQANVALIHEPTEVVHAYSTQLSNGLRDQFLRNELLAALVGGAVLRGLFPRARLATRSRGSLVLSGVLLVGVAAAASSGAAVQLFHAWPCSEQTTSAYPIPGVAKLSFGNVQTREIAEQVRPFIDKNTRRIEADAKDYESAASTSFAVALASREPDLVPRADESIVLAEADPQGSDVGVAVRKDLYRHLVETLGPQAISLRTISGDVSSNGTVAESGYIARESKVSGTIPTVAVGGDHDSVETWRQLARNGVVVPDLRTDAVAGLDVAGANDREHKTLFGGMFTNASGISEQQLGAMLRSKTDKDGARIVLLHQPDAVAGYLGLDDLDPVRAVHGSRTTPYDDGIPDQPPGIVDIGHLHQLDGPWVLWNTDGPEVTWTVVDQLGTAGGVENAPTFSRFSTPVSAPLKPLTVRLQYVDTESGLETGYATIRCGLDGGCRISGRVDVGLPGGKPLAAADLPDRSTPSRPSSWHRRRSHLPMMWP